MGQAFLLKARIFWEKYDYFTWERKKFFFKIWTNYV